MIDSSWIIYNRPKSLGSNEDAMNEHAGFLLALGLNGHLKMLSAMNIHEYLCRGNELTRVAILLGLAAARRGSMDAEATKVLSIHIEALLPPTSTELDIPPVVQVAAVMGIGLLYQGSGNGHMAEVLLNEIGRPPGPEMEHYIDRESYALAAGLAFGLVTLGKGSSGANLCNFNSISTAQSTNMADQLFNYMVGGYKKPLSVVQREKYKTPSYQIREGDYVNADVTSPGATLALGMMFFDSNNQAVARWVTAPDTQTLLETVRPDFLMLRTLAKGLILWSNIEPSKEWVSTHIPQVVAQYAFKKHEEYNRRIDYETMSQAYCNIIAGACMALGLKFAGSANKDAFKAVMGYTKMFLQLPNKPPEADQAGRSTVESCLNVLVVSLSLIMAGTGDLEVMKICRYLRARTSQVNVVLYGSHMATHMALGFLFLGGCRYSISTSKESIAALICSLFPKFPILSHDNRYHLQAFRHLYVLSVEPRLIIPRDIDSGDFCYVRLKLYYKKTRKSSARDTSLCSQNKMGIEAQEELKEENLLYVNGEACQVSVVRAPFIMPELDQLDKVVVDDDRYWRICFERGSNWDRLVNLLTSSSGVLNVKKKVGCLPYHDDPQGFKSVHSHFALKDAVKGWAGQESPYTRLLSNFSTGNNNLLSHFSRFILTPEARNPFESRAQQALCSFLIETASSETMEGLESLLQLDHYRRDCRSGEDYKSCMYNSLDLWQVKLGINTSRLGVVLEEGLKNLLESKVREADWKEIMQYLRGEISLSEASEETAQVVVILDMPPFASMSPLQENKMWSFPDLVSNLRHFNLPMSTLVLLSCALNP